MLLTHTQPRPDSQMQGAAHEPSDTLEALYQIAGLGHDDIANPDHRAVREQIVVMARDAIVRSEARK